MATQGEWCTVTRRKPKTTTGNHLHNSPPPVQPFKPFHTIPSFADMVRRPSPTPPNNEKSTSTPSSPSPTATPTRPAFYISPHSPSQLRFPPSAKYVEWRGRCFQCCGMGHSAAQCRNPKRCGKCWGLGHVGSRCSLNIYPTAKPNWPTKGYEHQRKKEPRFDDILESPIISKPMPEDRPQKTMVFVDRDDEYFQELAKLEGAVIMDNPNLELDLTIEQVAQYAVRSNLVTAEDISIGVMTRSRYIIMLPHGLAPDTFIKAIPLEIWQEGFSFYQWSPLDDATVAMPHFKVLIDLVGIPLDLFREKEVIRATSSMGTYLGTVAQPRKGDVAIWTVVVATTNLSLVPHQIGYMVGGLEIPVDVIPKTWKHCPLYKASEVAQPKEKYKPTFPAATSSSTSSEETFIQDDGEIFHISKSLLVQLCRGSDLSDLPEAVRTALTGTAMAELTRARIDVITADPIEATPLPTILAAPADPTADLMGAEIEGEVSIPVTLDVVRDTYEAGLSDLVSDSLQDGGHESLQQEVNMVSHANPHNKSVEDFSKNPPRILQRGNDNVIEAGNTSKTAIPTKTCTIFSPRVLRPSTRQKRKIQENARGFRARASSSRKTNRAKKQARIVTNLDGLVEVNVTYEHCSRLATALGFTANQVQQAMEIDNEERARTVIEEIGEDEDVQQTQTESVNDAHLTDLDQGEHLTDFDPDSEDELSSDFE